MLRNYLLIAFRNLWHNKFYTVINILGLAIGLTASLFIFQYVQFEKSYDNFHENANNIYRLISQGTINGIEESPKHYSHSAFGPIVLSGCPEVLGYARLSQKWTDNFIISYNPTNGTPSREFLEDKVYYTEASFMDMFSFPMMVGESKALQEPNNMLLSKHMAQKFFGKDWQTSEIVGKILTVNGENHFMVAGVFEDVPENSHIKFEVLLSLPTLAEEYKYDTEWHGHFKAYLLINSNADKKKLEDKLINLLYQYQGDTFKKYNASVKLSLQPVRDAHLHSSSFKAEPEIRGNATTVQFLFISGCFILMLAWINYVNLSTARAIKRAKEVGIRKVVGAGRIQLIAQFLLEAFLINGLSLILAGTFFQFCYSSFTHLVLRDIPINSLITAPALLAGIGLLLVVGTLLSGGYAAFVLSSFKAVSIMKGKFYTSSRGILLRKSLIVFQFIISVGLIVGTFCVYQQLVFMKNYEKGYDMAQKLIVKAPMVNDRNYGNQYENFKVALQQLPEINQITASYLSPGDPRGKGDQFVTSKKHLENLQFFSFNSVDYDYLETYGIQLLHGRAFSREFPTDQDAVIITEDVALSLGFDPVEKALQETVLLATNWLNKEAQVIGIAKNVSLYSAKLEQTGVVFMLGKENQEYNSFYTYNYFTIDLDNLSHFQDNIAYIEALYKDLFPGNPFTYFFLDEYFNAQYQAEEQFGKVFTAASSLAIFIACLGLLGLSAFMIRQRTKEIGIRKVLGAPVQSILLLLSSDYMKLIFISSLIALPVAYWGLNQWLTSFLVRISLSWWIFLFPVVMVILVALITVSIQTIKAAIANPAKSLRCE